MDLIPEHAISLYGVWWFSLLYGILSIGIMFFLPKDRRKRILSFPKFKTKSEKIFTGMALFIFGRGLIIYTIFLPLKWNIVYSLIGILIYLIGMGLSVYSMWFFSKADLNKPVTGGIYRITRHPMQVMGFVMWIGIGIVASNWILIILAFLLGVVSLPSFKTQENFCIEKYGDEYINYLKETPRYLLFK